MFDRSSLIAQWDEGLQQAVWNRTFARSPILPYQRSPIRRVCRPRCIDRRLDALTRNERGEPMESSRLLPGRRTGFSLLETLIVLSILGIVFAVALPSYSRYASTQRARATAHVLASDLRVAQQEAMTRRSAINVTFLAADPLCRPNAPSYVIGDPQAAI